jgi:hypothetical protein
MVVKVVPAKGRGVPGPGPIRASHAKRAVNSNGVNARPEVFGAAAGVAFAFSVSIATRHLTVGNRMGEDPVAHVRHGRPGSKRRRLIGPPAAAFAAAAFAAAFAAASFAADSHLLAEEAPGAQDLLVEPIPLSLERPEAASQRLKGG